MKKGLAIILSLIMCLLMVVPASADELNYDATGLYILTESVPQEAVEHVQSSIADMLAPFYNVDSLKVGTPFKLFGTNEDIYYFVIYYDDEIIGTYRAYNAEGYYTGIFSENPSVILGLQEIASMTSLNSPAKIVAGNYDDMYAIIDVNIYTLLSDRLGAPTQEQDLLAQPFSSVKTAVIDASEGIDFEYNQFASYTNPPSKFLNTGFAEKQNDNEWCMAYVTASIVRYKTGKSLSEVSAEKVMKWAFPSITDTEKLKGQKLSDKKAVEFGNTYRLNPISINGTRTYAQIASDIQADNPVAFIGSNMNDGGATAHAFLCRGYYDSGDYSYYSVWNPWYNKYEIIYSKDNIYTSASGNYKYKWARTVFNWADAYRSASLDS